MEWFWLWFMKPFAELAFGLLLLAVIGIGAALFSIPRIIRQRRCKHERFYETRSCDAVCTDCGKNLGFIGTVRENRRLS